MYAFRYFSEKNCFPRDQHSGDDVQLTLNYTQFPLCFFCGIQCEWNRQNSESCSKSNNREFQLDWHAINIHPGIVRIMHCLLNVQSHPWVVPPICLIISLWMLTCTDMEREVFVVWVLGAFQGKICATWNAYSNSVKESPTLMVSKEILK